MKNKDECQEILELYDDAELVVLMKIVCAGLTYRLATAQAILEMSPAKRRRKIVLMRKMFGEILCVAADGHRSVKRRNSG